MKGIKKILPTVIFFESLAIQRGGMGNKPTPCLLQLQMYWKTESAVETWSAKNCESEPFFWVSKQVLISVVFWKRFKIWGVNVFQNNGFWVSYFGNLKMQAEKEIRASGVAQHPWLRGLVFLYEHRWRITNDATEGSVKSRCLSVLDILALHFDHTNTACQVA